MPISTCEKLQRTKEGLKEGEGDPHGTPNTHLPSSVSAQEKKTPLSVKAIGAAYYMISNDPPCHLVMSSTFKMAKTIYLVKQACLSMDA